MNKNNKLINGEKERAFWAPKDAVKLIQELQNKYNYFLNESFVEEVIFGFNKIYKNIEEK